MIGVMPCSGACNVGQMSTKAVVEAIQQRPGEISFVCALGLPLQIPGIVKKAHENYTAHVAVNGCKVACATKALQSVGLEPETSLLVTDAICCEKNGDLTDETRLPDLVESVLAAVDAVRTADKVEEGASPVR
jgi:uncharacterized metal-binding protein